MAGVRANLQRGYSDADLLDMLWRRDVLRQSASQIALIMGATRNSVLGALHRVDRNPGDSEALSDGALLMVLDEFHGRGVAAEALARRLRGNRLQVLHLLHQLRLDYARSNGVPPDAAPEFAPPELARATKPGNRNGDLPLGWWAAGIAAREVAA